MSSNENTKKKLIEPRKLKGFRDLLPEEAILKSELITKLKKTFESFAYIPIETPHLEFTEVLMPQASDEISKQLFRFQDNGGRDVCLRFDLTVPFARFVSENKSQISLPFKRYAIGSVFRGERPQFGRYREFTQCDFDFVGINSKQADCETLELVVQSIKSLGVDNFHVHFNSRELINALSEMFNFQDNCSDVLRIVDKLAKIGQEECALQLKNEAGLSDAVIEKLFNFIEISSKFSGSQIFVEVRKLNFENENFHTALTNLEITFQILSQLPVVQDHIKLDFSIARGLGYYTGIVFETFLDNLPSLGSVCSGGRYDNLVSNYLAEPLYGVGGSVGLDRLIAGLLELNLMQKKSTVANCLITLMSEENRLAVYKLASQLRSNSINVEVYPDAVKLGKQFQYAEKKSIKWVIVLGADEIANGQFTLKNMETRGQEVMSSLNDLLEMIRSH